MDQPVFLVPVGVPDYGPPQMHDIMLCDGPRVDAYRQAIAKLVAPGDVVVDVGCGTGVLSIFAALAGAKRVYAIEATKIIDAARRIAEENGVADRITFIQGKADELTPDDVPEPADVIVSEWMGNFGLYEDMLWPLLRVRDQFLRPGGKMLPDEMRLWVAPVEAEDIYDFYVGKWSRRQYGLNFAHLGRLQSREIQTAPMQPNWLLCEPQKFMHLHVGRMSPDRAVLPPVELSFRARRDGLCHGVAGWFDVSFEGAAVLDTSPFRPPTHWLQTFLPLAAPIKLSKGDEIAIEFTMDWSDRQDVTVRKRVIRPAGRD